MRRFFGTCVKYLNDEGLENIKICKDCKYFKPDTFFLPFSKARLEFGKCGKSVNIDLISGRKRYDYASTVREYECKGEWFKSKDNIFKKYLRNI